MSSTSPIQCTAIPRMYAVGRACPKDLRMGVNWAAGLIRWRPHTSSDGKMYSLAHLHPFRFTCELRSSSNGPARTIAINVGFGLHVFTCAFENAEPGADEYVDDRERRAFDCERYRASLHLGALVRELETRKCYFAKNQNFFTIETTCAPAGHEYRVFFTVGPDRANSDAVTLIVQSAYFGRVKWGHGDGRKRPVRFRVILLNTLLGKPLREPP